MKCMLLQLKAYLIALLFLSLQPSETRAQESSIIKGIVNGANSQHLTDVSVIIRNNKTNFTSGTKTDGAGVFTARVPSGGPYTFSFSMVGYEPQTLSGYNIKEGARFTFGG